MSKTLFDKIWQEHFIKEMPDGTDLIHIDRHLLHEMTSPQAFDDLRIKQRKIHSPHLCFAVADHMVSTAPGRESEWVNGAIQMISVMADNAKKNNITYFAENHSLQGIIHVIAPELGITLPGMTVVCGDSHTCTNGALGTVAFGIGTSDVAHVLATQTVRLKRPKNMQISFEGKLNPYIMTKDIALYIIGKITNSGATGYAIEFNGSLVKNMGMDERLTLCNLSIELGARIGLIAPDEITFNYMKNRLYSPKGNRWNMALNNWKNLYSDNLSQFEKKYVFDVTGLKPQITWGTSPDEVINVDDLIPDPQNEASSVKREILIKSLSYMQLEANTSMRDVKIDKVFIGSCTNSRLADLRAAANIVKGYKVAQNVKALVVPGSQTVKRLAEQEGLHEIFLNAGFEWRESGCSMCIGLNADRLQPGERCVSTSNRNYVGRQGPGGRTHLASPMVAAAAAIAGHIINPQDIR